MVCRVTAIETESVERLLVGGALEPAYQPIVDLATRQTVGFEALARWPDLNIRPDQAFAAAAVEGRIADLDRACQIAALRGACRAGLRGQALFVNAEPATFDQPPTGELEDALSEAAGRFPIVVEITERALLRSPADLLRACQHIRRQGWGIALDDVGAVPDSLAALPFIAPDVIKLDLELVQRRPGPLQARIITAVMAHAERTGATVLAEGIETTAHFEQAVALGATVGQGWYYARAGAMRPATVDGLPRWLLSRSGPAPRTPFALVAGGELRVGRKALLLGLSRHLEQQGMSLDTPPVVLGAFQHADRFTPATSRRYIDLAGRCSLVAAFGEDLPLEPAPGVRGGRLRADDPLCGEWTVVIVGPHYAGALIARDLGDAGPDQDRRYAFAVTHDRDTVLAAGRSILERVEEAAPHPATLS